MLERKKAAMRAMVSYLNAANVFPAMAYKIGILLLLLITWCYGSTDTSPPSISKQPKPTGGQEMYIMDARVPLELECGATGTPPPTYKWLKYDPDGTNPVELDPSDARIMINDGDLKVGIARTNPPVVTEEDEGLYQCIAENSYGSALSKKINASIAFMDAFSWTSSKTVTAQIGETTVLECNPPNGVPPSYMSLYWTTGIRPPLPIETTARVLQDVMGNLVFANAQPEDTRDYKCNAPNQFIGEVRISPVIQFIVLEDSPAPERGPTLVSKPPIETEVLRTKTLSLECIAEGNPTPEITWTWPTNPGDRAEANDAGLKVRNVEFEDEGDYTCTASNGVGADVSYTSTVIVRSAPYWDPNPPTDTTIAPKESVTITCQSGGSPAATVSWLINGKTEDEVEANPRRQIISGQGSGQIIVTNAETSDSAVFQCIAKNVYGEEITNVFLNVYGEEITNVFLNVQGTNLTIYDARQPTGYANNDLVPIPEGENITFQCEIFGVLVPSSIDFFIIPNNGDDYDPQPTPGNKQLEFHATRGRHNSTLRCYASALIDLFTSIVLQVTGPPEDPIFDNDVSSLVGNRVVILRCTSIGGFPAPTIQWRVAGNILPSTKVTTTDANDSFKVVSTLELLPTRKLNQKKCQCEVIYSTAEPPQIVEKIMTVFFCPNEVTLQCPTSIPNGTEHTFTCSATEGNPRAMVSWRLQDETINDGITSDVSSEDAEFGGVSVVAKYTTLVTKFHNDQVLECRNKRRYSDLDCNPIRRDRCIINALYQPIITVVSSVENKEGSAVLVTCTVDANPQASITWTKLDAPNSDVDHNEESNGTSTLTLNPVNREHAGIYNCESSNMVGDMAQSVRVYVLYTPTKIPSIYTGPTSIYQQNELITLTCEFEAQPLANIRWYYENGTEVKEHDRLIINQYPNITNSFRPRIRSDLSIEGAVKNVDEGMYRCEASNSQGLENINFAVEIRNDLPGRLGSNMASTVTAIIIVLLACVGVVFIVIFVVRRKRRQRYQMETETDNGVIDLPVVEAPSSAADTALPERRYVDAPALDNNQPTVTPGHNVGGDDLYANVTANFNFPRNKLEILNELGQGAFGRVLLAKATGIMGIPGQQDVAVKTLKESAPAQDKNDLLQEVALMKILKPHPNVVRLLGCCIETDPIYVIVEYMDKGNLKIFLRKDRNKNKDAIYGNLHGLSTSLTIIQLMKFADQVAKGMEYLSMQKCIHRDLAARNVLINKDLICKVSDFGLARDVMNGKVYQRQRDEFRLPIRWMAVESISENIFSTESDVWAFGILLWEIITLGARPYPGTDTKDVINGLKIGMRMPCPKHCPEQIYNIMEACWRTNPKDRPTFAAICAMMQEILESETMNVAMETPEESLYAVTEISLANEKL